MKTLIFATILLAGCGSGDSCGDHTWDTKVVDNTGNHIIRCSEFQCPGYPAQRRCWQLY